MKVYISGPITGIKNNNEEAFALAESELISRGDVPINPLKINPNKNNPQWNDYMKADIKEMLDCDALFMLLGWEKSKGATVEHNLAKSVGIPIEYKEDL